MVIEGRTIVGFARSGQEQGITIVQVLQPLTAQWILPGPLGAYVLDQRRIN